MTRPEASPESSDQPIYVIDELRLKEGQLEPFLTAMEARYRPGAEARGQRLLHTLVTPPTATPGLVQTVLLIWELDGVGGFWTTRSQNATPEVIDWWADCESMIVHRTRRFATPPDLIPTFDALGRLNA